MNSGFIFDMNGTMVFDSPLHERAWGMTAKAICGRDIQKEEFVTSVHGRTNFAITAHFLGRDPTPEELEKYSVMKESAYRELCQELGDKFRLAPGLPAFLDHLKAKGVPMNIATASVPENMAYYIEAFQLERWFDLDQLVYDDGTLKGKPDPDIYLRAAQRMGVDPAGCVVFEDAESGMASAYAAGVHAIVAVEPGGDFDRYLALPGVCMGIRDFFDYGKLMTLLPERG